MSSLLTNYSGNYLLEQLVYAVGASTPKVKVALHTANPTVTGSSANEVSGGSYEREPGYWSVPSNKGIANVAAIQFDDLPSCTVSHIGIWSNEEISAPSVCIAVIQLTTPVVVPDGYSFKIATSGLAFGL